MNYIDEKVTIWNRLHFKDSADMEAMIDFIKNSREDEIYEGEDFDFCESLVDSEGRFEPEDNGGNATIEIYKDNEMIWDNSLDKETITWTSPKFSDIQKELKNLIDEGYNTEYTRGALEIISSFMKPSDDMIHADIAIQLAKDLGIPQENIDKLY